MLVCHCNNVCDRVIRQCVREGARSTEAVQRACQAGTSCGGCLPLVQDLVQLERARISTDTTSRSMDEARAAV